MNMKIFNYERRVKVIKNPKSWLLDYKYALYKKYIRNKQDPIGERVYLMEINPLYCVVEFENGRIGKVSTDDLSPLDEVDNELVDAGNEIVINDQTGSKEYYDDDIVNIKCDDANNKVPSMLEEDLDSEDEYEFSYSERVPKVVNREESRTISSGHDTLFNNSNSKVKNDFEGFSPVNDMRRSVRVRRAPDRLNYKNFK